MRAARKKSCTFLYGGTCIAGGEIIAHFSCTKRQQQQSWHPKSNLTSMELFKKIYYIREAPHARWSAVAAAAASMGWEGWKKSWHCRNREKECMLHDASCHIQHRFSKLFCLFGVVFFLLCSGAFFVNTIYHAKKFLLYFAQKRGLDDGSHTMLNGPMQESSTKTF